MRDYPHIEFYQGYAIQVWYDKQTDSYTLTNPISNEGGILNYVLQCKTIEFGRKQFVQMNLDAERIVSKLNQQ